jgi:hypothetical protein
MPRISAFYGIFIWMYWEDHNPPHFHATYNEFEILINITDLSVYAGYFPARAFGLLMGINSPTRTFRKLGIDV